MGFPGTGHANGMDKRISEGQMIVGSDDRKIGRVTGEEDGCVLVQTGHVFKSMHALPEQFVHEIDGELRATISREIVERSPELDADWSAHDVLLHYGIGGPYRVDPDPDEVGSAETAGAHVGIEPEPSKRIRTLGEPVDEERPVDEARRHGNSGGYWPVTPRKN